MTRTAPAPRSEQPSFERAARGLAAAGRPLGLGAWREVSRTGSLLGDPDPDSTAAGLVRRWHQHLAVAIDLPMERLAPGEERLPALVTAWLDLARRTQRVRAHVATTAGARTAAESARQTALLARLLGEDLALMGVPEPGRSALDLLSEMAAVAAAEDEAGTALPRLRAGLLGTPDAAARRAWRDRVARLTCRLHPSSV